MTAKCSDLMTPQAYEQCEMPNVQSAFRNPKSQAPILRVSGFSVQVSALLFFPWHLTPDTWNLNCLIPKSEIRNLPAGYLAKKDLVI